MSDSFCGELKALTPVNVEKWHDGVPAWSEDTVAVEAPVALEYNGISHAVMMASPHDLEDLALGFSVSEGILGDASELYESEVFDAADVPFASLTQSFTTTTSMGRLPSICCSPSREYRAGGHRRVHPRPDRRRQSEGHVDVGGRPPFGDEVRDRKLHIVEAETARRIFVRYAELGSVLEAV